MILIYNKDYRSDKNSSFDFSFYDRFILLSRIKNKL